MSTYSLKLNTLTPIHIGDGDVLRQGFDYIVFQRRTYRLNVDAILEAYNERIRPGSNGMYPTPGELLKESDLNQPNFFRYSLAGMPRSGKTYSELRSFLKDVYDCPYIPGSSLKGAMRTALAWCGWKEVNPRLDRAAIGRSRSWAGQPLERKLFGPDPNHDLLRALQVSDCTGSPKAGARLVVVNAQVLTKRSHASPVELEAVSADSVFTGSLHIDDHLFSDMAERQLGFNNRRHWIDELLPRVHRHSLARIRHLAAWFASADGCESIAGFYARLADARVESNQALLQLGWGTGWDGTTFWTHLQADKNLFEQLVRDFRLHKAGPNSPPRRPGDPFPRSRRAAMRVINGVAAPAAPLGWMLIELTPR